MDPKYNDSSYTRLQNYNSSYPIRIWFGNLAAYNEGILRGIWLTLPMPEDDLQKAMKAVLLDDEEYLLNDYESDIPGICSEYSNPYKLNEIAEFYEDLYKHEQDSLIYLLDEGFSWEQATEKYQDVICYDGNLEDVAAEMVEEGCFGEIPQSIKGYIDYEAIAYDLSMDGYKYNRDIDRTFFYQ